jgi:hypothetical protein
MSVFDPQTVPTADKSFANRPVTVTAANTSHSKRKGNLTMVTSNSEPLVELEAEIVELEGEIVDRTTRDRILAIPKKLFSEAQDYHRHGNEREARLTINCACQLLDRAKNEFKK